MSQRRSGFGAKLLLGDGESSESFTEIPGVGDFGAPFPQAETSDATGHDSEGRWREKVQTLRDGGTLTVPIWFDPEETTHQDLLEASGEVDGGRNFQIEAPTGETIAEFEAFVGVDGSNLFPREGAQQISVSLEVNGEVKMPFLEESSSA